MNWFNYYGLAIIIAILLPNLFYLVNPKKANTTKPYQNKSVEILEQIGKYGCLVFMIFNIPYTYFNFWFKHAFIVYITVNVILTIAYLAFWLICKNKDDKLKALSLSILPTTIFMFSGVMLLNIPLIAFSILFGVTHIFISVKNITNKVATKKQAITLQDIIIFLFVIFLIACAIYSYFYGTPIL